MSKRDDLTSDEVEAFATAMWAPDFAASVTRDQVRSLVTPMLVLPGVDQYHPTETGREIAARAPAAELLEPWKDPEHLPAPQRRSADFFATTPRARSAYYAEPGDEPSPRWRIQAGSRP